MTGLGQPDPSAAQLSGAPSDPKPASGGFSAQLQITPGRPAVIRRDDSAVETDTPGFAALAEALSLTLKAYREHTEQLVAGKYAALSDLIHPRARSDQDGLAFLCDDGIVIRYQPKAKEKRELLVAIGGSYPKTLRELLPVVSENLVHWLPIGESVTMSDAMPKIVLSAEEPDKDARELFWVRVVFVGHPAESTSTFSRPTPLLSVRPEMEMHLLGFTASEQDPTDSARKQHFLLRSQLRAPVGWNAIDVFPPFDPDIWRPELAATWAELDLLGAAAERNVRELRFVALDPNANARQRFAALFSRFRELLGGPEAPLQEFLGANPLLLSPGHLKVWPKVPFGRHVSDFVFQESTNDYLLVEIEAPTRALFRKGGQRAEPLVHAEDQVADWVRYIRENLDTVRRELGLVGISPDPRALVVIGRSSSLTDADRAKLRIIEDRNPRLKIVTYDDVLAMALATVANFLGPLWETGGAAQVYNLSGPALASVMPTDAGPGT